MKAQLRSYASGQVYCPICARTVPAQLDLRGKRAAVATGERCPRCHSSLEVAAIVQIPETA